MSKKITTIKPGSYVYSQDEPFRLVTGDALSHLDLAFETYGELNSAKDNVIVLHHSLSMSAHAANLERSNSSTFDYDHKSQAGWWDNMIGSGKALDPNKYHIICINNLGSCFGSTGPNNYSGKFPIITIHDIARSQKLLLDYLGITKVKLIIGSSMGGMISLAWLQLFPSSLENLFLAACAHKAYPINIFNRMIQQEIIGLSPNNPNLGLKVARMLGFYNYRSNTELNDRFKEDHVKMQLSALDYKNNAAYKHSELYSYFEHNAEKFAENFDVRSYLCMLNAMDLFDLSALKSYHSRGYPLSSSNVKITIVGITTDILFPMWQQYEIYELLKESGYQPKFIEHDSDNGHDAFLKEHEKFGTYIACLLDDHKKPNGVKSNHFWA